MIRYIHSKNKVYPVPTGYSISDAIGWTEVVTSANTLDVANNNSNYCMYYALK